MQGITRHWQALQGVSRQCRTLQSIVLHCIAGLARKSFRILIKFQGNSSESVMIFRESFCRVLQGIARHFQGMQGIAENSRAMEGIAMHCKGII